jgi:hypothetical protein
MSDGRSLPVLLRAAIDNPSSCEPDLSLIGRAVAQDFFVEASKLIAAGYPTGRPLSDIIADRLCSPVKLHDDQLFGLIFHSLVLFPSDSSFTRALAARQIHPANLPFAALPVLFDRYRDDDLPPSVPADLRHLFPTARQIAAKAFTPSDDFYSIFALSRHIHAALERLVADYSPTRQRPSAELLNFQLRTALESLLVPLEAAARAGECDPDILSADCLAQLITVADKHRVTLEVRRQAMFLLQAVPPVAKRLPAATIDVDVDLSFPEALVLLEARALVGCGDQARVERLRNAVLGFEAAFLAIPDFKSAINTCLIYPANREERLVNGVNTQTHALLVRLRQSLLYIPYALSAGALANLMEIERLAFVAKMTGAQVPDLAPAVRAFNRKANAAATCERKFAQVLSKLKGLSIMSVTVYPLQFTEAFPKWTFREELAVGDLAYDDVMRLIGMRVETFRRIIAADLGIQLQKICIKCQKRPSKVVCRQCSDFVCCAVCLNGQCPKCHEPIGLNS